MLQQEKSADCYFSVTTVFFKNKSNSAYANPPAEVTNELVKQFPSSHIRALFNTTQY
jgi:hypothetical protein